MELTPRLRAIAEQVPQGARLADIGTDHGYLPVWLLLAGLCAVSAWVLALCVLLQSLSSAALLCRGVRGLLFSCYPLSPLALVPFSASPSWG